MRASGLARLECARILRGPVPLGTLVFTLAAAFAPTGAPLEGESAIPAWALARETYWTAALLFYAPAYLFVLGGVLARWRRGEADWIGSRPVGRGAALLWTWLGAVSAAVVICAGIVCVSELPAGAASRARTTQLVARVDVPEVVRIDPGGDWSVLLDVDGVERGRLRARILPIAGGAPTTDARLTVRAGATRAVVDARVTARTWIEATIPAHAGEVHVTLENRGDGELALLAQGGLEVWAPGGSALRGVYALALRTLLALAALGALAFGCGAWVSTPSAAAFAGATWLAAVAVYDAPTWFPGADLPRALSVVGEGRLPGAPGLEAYAGAACMIALGLGLARAGLRSWRHSG